VASSCRGRHIQKLHDFLKDVFREANRVHVVHGDDGWEESDEAWELGEEETMIVGTVQQEDDYSWQDACGAWMEQDEEVAAGVHQVSACQGVVEQAAAGQCKKADTSGEGEEASEPGGLLLEGEEQEYFLELLMRRASPERPKASLSIKGKTAPAKGKKNRSKGKKAHGKGLAERTANERMREERATSSAGGLEKQPAPDPANNPKAKNRGLAESDQQEKEQVTGTHTTSGGECSGQKTPDYP
jgi:hypothetical protein